MSSDDDELCGECKLVPSSDSFMIQCDGCNAWFHGRCCGLLTEWQAAEFDIFHCKNCTKHRGPSKRKKRENWHRHDCFETGADSKPAQCGTVTFLETLKNRPFSDALEVVIHIPDGSSVTREFFEKNGFPRPLLIDSTDGLNMRIPDSFSVESAVNYLGENWHVDVIDSERQLVFDWTLGQLRDYFKEPPEKREKVYNMISLEFSGTRMEQLVTPPHAVTELSWLPAFWPASQHFARFTGVDCPRTDQYLLTSAQGAYTDCHIDFGGSSVWYHIAKGSKVFYIAPPTDHNLKAYEKWYDAKDRVDRFLGSELKPCYRLNLSAGQTLIMPGGWIHGVVTVSDSIVFGGNFLHSLSIPIQLRIYDLEQHLRMDPKLLFPQFHSVSFFAARHLSEQLRDMCEDVDRDSARKDAASSLSRSAGRVYLALIFTGCSVLLSALRRWIADDKCMKRCVLSANECSTIASELQRSIRLAELKKVSLPSSVLQQYSSFQPKKTSSQRVTTSEGSDSRKKAAKRKRETTSEIASAPSSSSSSFNSA